MTEIDPAAIVRAARLLATARESGERLDRFAEELRPQNGDEAYAIQRVTLDLMGDQVAGWKVAIAPDVGLMAGILVRSGVFADGATVPSEPLSMFGIEAEIAFRFDETLAPRDEPYERAEIESAVTAFPAIEIVETRFRDYDATPAIERAADFMANGGFIVGAPRDDWRSFDLAALEARVIIDGKEVVRRTGGHAAGDPLVPAIALVNHMRLSDGIAAGMMVTTGTYTGLEFAARGSTVEAIFTGFGSVGCRFSG
ncbi:MAG: hypothetical protein KDJ88_05275 [Bauldia sp.]|nr:hypothetical protein [Bauldia sp.]